MSDRGPGTRAYLVETAVIVGAGLVLAIWLWDGWPFVIGWAGAPVETRAVPRDLGEYFDAGCVTAENLRAMAEGRSTRILCPDLEAP